LELFSSATPLALKFQHGHSHDMLTTQCLLLAVKFAAVRLLVVSPGLLSCRHTKHRQDKVLQELTSSATPPAPVDIEELNKVGRHAEVSKQLVRQQYWGSGSANK
jgi:hypothetical protein